MLKSKVLGLRARNLLPRKHCPIEAEGGWVGGGFKRQRGVAVMSPLLVTMQTKPGGEGKRTPGSKLQTNLGCYGESFLIPAEFASSACVEMTQQG